jgi:hypothetical protein
MKGYIIRAAFLGLCLLAVKAGAQQGPSVDFTMWNIGEKDARYVFSDTAYVRSGPSIKSQALDTLLAGDEITVMSTGKEPFTLKGITARWLSITYTKNGTPRQGYIWEGLVSFTPMRRGTMKFVYGLNRIVDSSYVLDGEKFSAKIYQMGLKAVSEGRVQDVTYFKIMGDESSSFTEGSVTGGRGMQNIQQLVCMNFGGEACGVPTYHHYYGWTGTKLLPVLQLMDVGDADVYYHTEVLILPQDKGGKSGMLLVREEEGEESGKTDKNGMNIMTEKKRTIRYTWNGEKAVPVK